MVATTFEDSTVGTRPRPGSAGAIQTTVWVATFVLVVLPVLPLLYASLLSLPLYLPGGQLTLDGYTQLLADPLFWTAVKNTLGFAAIATTLAVSGGALFAILCTRTNLPGRRVFSLLILLPITLPPLGLLLGWVAIYGDYGYITVFLQHAHVPVWSLSSVVGMGILGGCLALPIAFLTCRASLQQSDTRLEAAARSAGATSLTVIRRVTLPLLRPALVNSAVLVAILALENVGIGLIVGVYNHVDLYGSFLYHTWAHSPDPDPTTVSAGAILLLVAVGCLLVGRRVVLRRGQRFVGLAAGEPGATPIDLGRGGLPFALLITAFLTFTVVIPILALLVTANVSVFSPLIPPWQVGTLNNWATLTNTGRLTDSIQHSLLIAAFGGLITTLGVAIATLVAHRSRFRLRATEGAMLLLPRSIPGIAIGLGVFWTYLLLNPPGGFLRNSIWGVGLALCVRSVTLPYLIILPSLSRIGTELDAAARSVGASWWRISTRIVLPQLRPALLAAFILMFVTLLNDYDPALFLVTPDSQIMGVTILQTYVRGLSGPVAALALVQVGITAVALGAGVFAFGRIRARH
jgi:iron(III) transport system permease protein